MAEDLVYPLLRCAHYGLLLGLFGLTAFGSFGLRETMSDHGRPILGRGITFSACAAFIVNVALMLVSISAMMAQPVSQLEWVTIEAMISATDLGWAFLARTAFLVAAVANCAFFARSAHASMIAALCFGLAVATLPWSGHAAASEGSLGLMHRMNDAVHLLAAGLWLGAIGWFLHLTVAAHRFRQVSAAPLLADMHRFASLGILLVAVVAVTGTINAQLIFGIENSPEVVGTNYGRLLLAKILLVGVMILFGARNAWIGRRQASFDNMNVNLSKLRVSLGAELSLAVLVIGLIAALGMMSPMGDEPPNAGL